MKLTVFQFEGTPEELDASSALRELVERGRGATVLAQRTHTEDNAFPGRVPGVADEGQETVRRLLGRSPAPGLFTDFLAETTRWEKVGVHGIKRKDAQPDDPLDYSRYLRLRRQGSQLGGFAYVYAEYSTINLRLALSAHELEELGVTARVLTTGHRAYRVSVDLSDKQSLDSALRLAKLAYDAT